MKWNHMLLQFGRMKHYFIACLAVFITGIVLGFGYSEHFQSFLDQIMKAMEGLAKSAINKDHPQASLFWVIFANNVTKSFQVLGLGVFFGVFPLFFLLTNGLLLGYISLLQLQKGSLFLLAKGILPHGIIEIPAIILASALGLRLGILVFKTVVKAVGPARSQNPAGELRAFLLSLVPSGILITVTLLVAAIIESTITYGLLKP